MLEVYTMYSNLLQQVESPHCAKVLDYIVDLAVDTNQLSYLIDAYSKIGQKLSEDKEYDKAIRLFKKMLKCIWIEGDTKKEIKLYEMLALQYFYLQEMGQCRKYQDRALRGKLEGTFSSAKSVTMLTGFRSSDDKTIKRKKVYHGAYCVRTNISKASDSIVHDYTKINELIDRIKHGVEKNLPQK